MEYDEAIEACDELLAYCEDVIETCNDIHGMQFAENVRDKTASIKGWIERNGYSTENQDAAIVNMTEGVKAWLREP